MGNFPGSSKSDFTKNQLSTIAICQYIELFLCLAVLGWIIMNSWKFLYCRGMYRVLPVLVFYITAFILVLFRIYEAIWFFVMR